MSEEIDLEEIFEFLDNLRESGTINMFGAPSVIREEFGLTKQESYDIFKQWTERYK